MDVRVRVVSENGVVTDFSGLCKWPCLRLRLANDHIDLRMLARIDTLMALFVVLFIEHEAADAVPSPVHAWQCKGSLAYYLLSLGLT